MKRFPSLKPALLLTALAFQSVAAEQVDILVYADHVVTMDPSGALLTDAGIAIDDGIIVDLGSRKFIESNYTGRDVLDDKSRIALPGLINGHSHAALSLFRGIADDLALFDWLNDYIFPAENQFADREFVRLGTELACWEMIRGGTTTFVDMYYFPDTVAETVERCGMRALVAATIIDKESPDSDGAEQSLRQGVEFIKRWKNRNPRITPILGPHANFTLSEKQLRDTRTTANQLGVGISVHVSESKFMNEYSIEKFGKTNIAMFESIDFFDGPTITAHVVWPTDEEIEILARRNVGVIHNPNSNMKLAAGIAPITKMIEAGVTIGLGTDSTASNNDLDMWEEMNLAALLQKAATLDPQALPAKKALALATIEGAKAIGLDDKIGSLSPGKRADVILVSYDNVHQLPMYDVISHLVYVTDQQDVRSTIVDGKVLMRNLEVLTIDTDRVAHESKLKAEQIRESIISKARNREVTQ